MGIVVPSVVRLVCALSKEKLRTWVMTRILIYASFHCLRLFTLVCRAIIWTVCGIYQHSVRVQNDPRLYSTSAQILQIHMRHKFDTIDEAPSLGNFITSHHAFVHPACVLQDHVTLYCLTTELAVFVESEKDVDVTNVEFGAFLRISQYERAKRLILLPMSSFHRLAEEIGDPRSKVILVSNTSRCGSTLICQLFQHTGKCVALSEPDPPNTINKLSLHLPRQEAIRITRSTICLLCKPIRERKVDAYVIKLSPVSPDAVPLIVAACPYVQNLFLYRDGLKVAQSLARAVQGGFATANLAFTLAKISPSITRAMIENMGFSCRECNVTSSEPLVWTFFLWALTVKKYLCWRQEGIDIVAVRYEDLQKDPQYFMSSILNHFGLPLSWQQPALEGLSQDSQRHSSISQDALSKVPTPVLTAPVKDVLNGMCATYGLAKIGEPCILQGTISCSSMDAGVYIS